MSIDHQGRPGNGADIKGAASTWTCTEALCGTSPYVIGRRFGVPRITAVIRAVVGSSAVTSPGVQVGVTMRAWRRPDLPRCGDCRRIRGRWRLPFGGGSHWLLDDPGDPAVAGTVGEQLAYLLGGPVAAECQWPAGIRDQLDKELVTASGNGNGRTVFPV
jgi:hypothetical protein